MVKPNPKAKSETPVTSAVAPTPPKPSSVTVVTTRGMNDPDGTRIEPGTKITVSADRASRLIHMGAAKKEN